jgi:hypothetical protein
MGCSPRQFSVDARPYPQHATDRIILPATIRRLHKPDVSPGKRRCSQEEFWLRAKSPSIKSNGFSLETNFGLIATADPAWQPFFATSGSRSDQLGYRAVVPGKGNRQSTPNRHFARRRRRHDQSHHRSGACIIGLSTSNVAMNAADDRSNSNVGVFILLPPSCTQAAWSGVRPRLGHPQ